MWHAKQNPCREADRNIQKQIHKITYGNNNEWPQRKIKNGKSQQYYDEFIQ
jgi:hypothetical protein